MRRELGIRDLVLFNIAAVVGVRWLAAAAHVGGGAVLLWLLAAIGFFIPCAVVVTELARRSPVEGGIYIWTRDAFGDWHGFLCGYCYWLNNLFYFPSLTVAGVAMAVSIVPEAGLSSDARFVTIAALAVIFGVTAANVVGWRLSKWIGNLGGTCTYLAAVTLVVAGLLAGSRAGWNWSIEFSWDRLNFWSQIAFAFGGLELGAILAGEVRDPAHTIRKSAWISAGLIAAFYIAGTLAILSILPAADVDPVTGLTQAGHRAAEKLGAAWPRIAIWALVTLGILGQLNAWMAGGARLPLVLGLDRFLPERFARLHPRYGTPHVALWWQAALCGALLVMLQAGENLRTGYQLLVDMAVITYFIPFIYLFSAAWKGGMRLPALSGLAVTLLAIGVTLVPPGSAESALVFEAKLLGGTALVVAFARWWYRTRRPALA